MRSLRSSGGMGGESREEADEGGKMLDERCTQANDRECGVCSIARGKVGVLG